MLLHLVEGKLTQKKFCIVRLISGYHFQKADCCESIKLCPFYLVIMKSFVALNAGPISHPLCLCD